MAQPDESFIELRDGRFKIRVLQAGSGDPLLYVHGAGGLFWDPLLDALSANHRVIAPEHPGAGDSQGLEHVEDLWDLVLYYNELLDSFGVEPGDASSATRSAAWSPPRSPPRARTASTSSC